LPSIRTFQFSRQFIRQCFVYCLIISVFDCTLIHNTSFILWNTHPALGIYVDRFEKWYNRTLSLRLIVLQNINKIPCIVFEKLNLRSTGVSARFSKEAWLSSFWYTVCTFQRARISLAWIVFNPKPLHFALNSLCWQIVCYPAW
jgi:hypothetical protein